MARDLARGGAFYADHPQFGQACLREVLKVPKVPMYLPTYIPPYLTNAHSQLLIKELVTENKRTRVLELQHPASAICSYCQSSLPLLHQI